MLPCRKHLTDRQSVNRYDRGSASRWIPECRRGEAGLSTLTTLAMHPVRVVSLNRVEAPG